MTKLTILKGGIQWHLVHSQCCMYNHHLYRVPTEKGVLLHWVSVSFSQTFLICSSPLYLKKSMGPCVARAAITKYR